MQLKTKGVVLKQRNIGEDDRIITVLTQEYGVIEVAARRVKSAKSGLSAPCQVLNYSEFCLYKGKGNYIINSAESIDSFYQIRLDVVKLSLCNYFCELTAQISPSAETAADFMRLLLNSFFLLQKDKLSPSLLKSIFELRAMSISGYMPNLVCCHECASYEAEEARFLPYDGYFLCENCFDNANLQGKVAFFAPPPVLSAMRHIVFSELEKLFFFKISDEAAAQLGVLCESYLLAQTDHTYKSLEIYKQLVNEVL